MSRKFEVYAYQYIEEEVSIVVDADEFERLTGREFDPGSIDAQDLHEYGDLTGEEPDISESGGASDVGPETRPTVCIEVES